MGRKRGIGFMPGKRKYVGGKVYMQLRFNNNLFGIIKRITFVIQNIIMKTKLPLSLTTASEVETFISDLFDNREFFHLDDDATDMRNTKTGEPTFTQEEGEKINALLEQAFAICDVWSLPIIDKILEESNKD